MIKIEEGLLSRATGDALKVRLSLANRERLSGVIKEFGRFDLKVDTGGGELALSKKDVYYISYPDRIVEPPATEQETESADRRGRSRVQDEFLARYLKDKTLALFTLLHGDEYRGVIEGFDGFTVLVKAGRGQLLIYKHGILSIGPGYRRRG